jgi:colanic acid/amylovoran biosynthesis protein
MKILVVNLHSSANAGDHVLTQETVRQLQEAFPSAAITLAMNDPDSYQGPAMTVGSFMTWIKQGRRWQWWKFPGLVLLTVFAALGCRVAGPRVLRVAPEPYRLLLQAYFEADLVVSSAGNFLYSSGRVGLPFLISIYTMIYALRAGKALYNMPQTVGPLHRRWEKRLVRWLVRRMPLFLVRDPISQHQLEEAGAWHSGCRLVPDLAFAGQPASRADGEALLRRYGVVPGTAPLLGVTLINWGEQSLLFQGQGAYEDAVAAAIRAFVGEQNGRCILFSQVRGPSAAEDDRVPAGRVRDALADLGDAVVLIDAAVGAAMLKSAYGCMDIFMGTRLHSNIFALTENVPVLTIQYQPKTRGVLRMLGLEEWVIAIEEVTGDDLYALLERLWQERATQRTYIRQQLAPVMVDASQVGALIANHYRERQ